MNKLLTTMGIGGLFGGVYLPVYCWMTDELTKQYNTTSWFTKYNIKDQDYKNRMIIGAIGGAFYFVTIPTWLAIRHAKHDVSISRT